MKMIPVGVANEIRCESHVLCARKLLIVDELACYRLLEHNPQYFMDCTFGREACIVSLGQGFAKAAMIFDMLVQGEVTPCSMGDIVADLRELEA